MSGGLSVRGLHVAYGKNVVLNGIDLDVAAGETLVLFGTSGAGKTVTLRGIAGLEPGARGRVTISGRDVSNLGPEAREIGVAFQNFALYPHMPARENIASPLRARGVAQADIDRRVDAVAGLLKIGHVLGHAPRQLSNGQKQRTALARALVGQPTVLLLDDPLRNVDAKLRYEMRMELPRLLRRAGAATIYVSQDYREAMALADRIAVLINGEIVQNDRPETIYDEPATTTVARLFGDPPVNLIPCRPVAEHGGLRIEAAGLNLLLNVDQAAAGRDCLLGLRPEDIAVHTSQHPEGAPLDLEAVTPLHERQVLLLRLPGGQELLSSILGEPPPAGSRVWIVPDRSRALLYDAGTGARFKQLVPALEAVA